MSGGEIQCVDPSTKIAFNTYRNDIMNDIPIIQIIGSWWEIAPEEPKKPRLVAWIDSLGSAVFRPEGWENQSQNGSHNNRWTRAPWLDQPEK